MTKEEAVEKLTWIKVAGQHRLLSGDKGVTKDLQDVIDFLSETVPAPEPTEVVQPQHTE